MKIGVLMCAFREKSKIESSIKQFSGLVDNIVIACSKSSWENNILTDDTYDLAVKAGATVRLHSWKDEKDQKNWGMELLSSMDWVIISAPDMYMTRESLVNLLDYLENNTSPSERAIGCAMKTYWKNLNTIIKPDWDFNTVAIRPTERFEYSSRLKNWTTFNKAPGVLVHHLSWVKTDSEMQTKLLTYTHANELVDSWYENVWLRWHKDMTNFHPTSPSDYNRTVKYELPKEIRELLRDKWIEKL